MPKCQICSKEACFFCSKCEQVYYCCKDHQIEDWRNSHKNKCFKKKEDTDQLLHGYMKKRYHTRKQFYDNYSNKLFDLCLLDAKVMVDFDKKIKALTNDILDEYEYAASVCALCRAFFMTGDKINARLVLQNYLAEAQDFLASFEFIPDVNGTFTDKEREIFQRKMNLVSTIANLSYALELQCVKYYVLYTKHIEKAFGKHSYEASNCYFLLGGYFAEEGFVKKAIACFMKSAACRGQLAGDCYFNIGILYSFEKKMSRALKMFQKALELRNEQHGEDSDQIAEVQENLGMIYVEMNDYITALFEYEKAFKIRAYNPYSPEYRNIIDLIHQLYDKLCLFIGTENNEMKKPSIFMHLKTKILQEEVYWKERRDKRNIIKKEQEEHIIDDQAKKDGEQAKVETIMNKRSEELLNISEDLMSRLNPTELFQLSELQFELSSCPSVFSAVYLIGKSAFLMKLTPENMRLLRKDNTKLFELLRVEELEKKRENNF